MDCRGRRDDLGMNIERECEENGGDAWVLNQSPHSYARKWVSWRDDLVPWMPGKVKFKKLNFTKDPGISYFFKSLAPR